MQKKQLLLVGICGLAVAILTALYVNNKSKHKPIRYLPYYGEKKLNEGDTNYHTVPDFSFINQDGKEVTRKAIEGKITVVDYFFTTCGSICPIMKKQMHRVYRHFENDPDIIFLSHTVDPEHDTVEVLNEFAKQYNVRSDKWIFVTGDKKKLYEVARVGYLLDNEKGDGGHEDFIHTQNFALVDKEFHVRGYYDGTDSAEVNRLIKEIEVLKEEYREVK